ncbi:hypothetical protein [Brevundimonas sp.]|uniref:hypothetical protein n=1 Tax=Brevundimonas sp. TaxID=1871086 RepID=UPI0028969ABA|nr:hypothetical protein [Brevundimonas sp.]
MTFEELKFEVGMMESQKRRASFPQKVAVIAYLAAAIIICLSIALMFPGDSAPEWLLLLLAPIALAGWFGISKIVENSAPQGHWTSQNEQRLQQLKLELLSRGGQQL